MLILIVLIMRSPTDEVSYEKSELLRLGLVLATSELEDDVLFEDIMNYLRVGFGEEMSAVNVFKFCNKCVPTFAFGCPCRRPLSSLISSVFFPPLGRCRHTSKRSSIL